MYIGTQNEVTCQCNDNFNRNSSSILSNVLDIRQAVGLDEMLAS